METAKIFENGGSQAVRLPKKYRFDNSEVLAQRVGDIIMLAPKDGAWEAFLSGLESFTEDYFAGGREQGAAEDRESL